MRSAHDKTINVIHRLVSAARRYDDVTRAFLHQLGRFDEPALTALLARRPSADELRAKVDAMTGTSGLMLFASYDHGSLVTALGPATRAVQYVLGNPLVAHQMTQHHLGAGLYAPLRALIYEVDREHTCLEYDLPSSLFGQFGLERIDEVARDLDRKMDRLVAGAVES